MINGGHRSITAVPVQVLVGSICRGDCGAESGSTVHVELQFCHIQADSVHGYTTADDAGSVIIAVAVAMQCAGAGENTFHGHGYRAVVGEGSLVSEFTVNGEEAAVVGEACVGGNIQGLAAFQTKGRADALVPVHGAFPVFKDDAAPPAFFALVREGNSGSAAAGSINEGLAAV